MIFATSQTAFLPCQVGLTEEWSVDSTSTNNWGLYFISRVDIHGYASLIGRLGEHNRAENEMPVERSL